MSTPNRAPTDDPGPRHAARRTSSSRSPSCRSRTPTARSSSTRRSAGARTPTSRSARASGSCSSPRPARRRRSSSAPASRPPTPGSGGSLLLTVDDIDAARAELIERGADVSEVFHGRGFSDAGQGRIPGRAPGRPVLRLVRDLQRPRRQRVPAPGGHHPPARARRGARRRRARRPAARDRPRARPLRGGHPGAQLVGLVRPVLQRAPAGRHAGAGDRGRRPVHEGGPRCGSPMRSRSSWRSRSS